MEAPTYIPIPKSACELVGPYRCPECSGAVMFDRRWASMEDTLFCPYCLATLRRPANLTNCVVKEETINA